MKYAILHNPGHNRVYFEAALKFAKLEFNILTGIENISTEIIAGIEYMTFESYNISIDILSDLSFAYAIFEIHGDMLKPIAKTNTPYIDESISTILKYTGKTNELFTKMLINIAMYTHGKKENINLLDPISGKGTTLYEGLIKHINVYGIEINEPVVNEAYHFIKKFLENAKYKFKSDTIKISGPNKSFSANRQTFTITKSKTAPDKKILELISGDSKYADYYYTKNFFDIIVGDLPYGVQHGNITKQASRNPKELLNACLPAWVKVLKPNGIIVLAWNINVLPRIEFVKILEDFGFYVYEYEGFKHRVDQSIMRDCIIAKRKQVR